MKLTIKEVNEDGIEIELDDEAEAHLEARAVEFLGEDACEIEKEVFKKQVLSAALTRFLEDQSDEV